MHDTLLGYLDQIGLSGRGAWYYYSMLDIASLAALAGVLIFAAHFFAWLFSFTRIPDALLLVGVGLLLGPFTGVLGPAFFGQAGAFAVIIVLVIILFEGGTQLRFSLLRESLGTAVVVTVTSFFATVLVVGLVMWLLLGLDVRLAFLVGSIVGGLSSAVVIPLLRQLQIGDQARSMLVLESALTDVLTIVVSIGFLDAYQLGSVPVVSMVVSVLFSFLAAAFVGVVAAFLWSGLLSAVRQVQNSIFLTPALVFILYGVTEALGWSGPIAALAFGIVMGNISLLQNYLHERHQFLHYLFSLSSLSKRERLFFAEVAFILQTFFFVFVGLSISFTDVWRIFLGVWLVLLLLVIRFLVVRFLATSRFSTFDALVVSSMIPRGLAAAALASLPLQRGVMGGALVRDIAYMVVLFSIVLTSILIFAVHREGVQRWYLRFAPGFRRDFPAVD